MASASGNMLRMVGVGKRDLRSLFQRQQVEDRMDVEDVALRNNEFLKPAKKKTKKRASLLRASEQCSAVLLALRHIMDDIREDGHEEEHKRMMEVDVEMGCDFPLDLDDDIEMDDDDSSEDFFAALEGDLAGSGRYVIPCKPHNVLLDDALSVPVLRRSDRKKRRKRKRVLESEKALKCNSLPLGFKLEAPKSWEVDSMTVQLDSMRIRNRRSHRRSPSQGSPEAETKKPHKPSAAGEPPSKRKAVAPPPSAGHKPPVDLPRLSLSDLPRTSCTMQYSPDLSKSCNIISPRSAFSRSPRNTSPIDVRRNLSPVNSAHQRPSMSPSPRMRSPLSSPSWTPRSSARMASVLLRQSSPTAHQNSN